jgi:pyruvyltransferase
MALTFPQKIPSLIARAAAISGLAVENKKEFTLKFPSLGDITRSNVNELYGHVEKISKIKLASLDCNHTAIDAGLAALCRLDMVINNSQISALGFKDCRNLDSLSLEEKLPYLDFNFDLALTLLVEASVWQREPTLPSQSYLEEHFLSDGRIPLLISTTNTDVSKIGYYGNVGDNFGLHVVRHLSCLDVNPFGVWAELDMPAMLTVGSFMQHAKDRGLVWGTGCITTSAHKKAPQSTGSIFFGVRGPRSREQILIQYGLNPPIVRDPGLLISDMVSCKRRCAISEVGFIVHASDKDFFRKNYPGALILRNNKSFEVIAEGILSCKNIISTSLHGVIFSHSLGVPASLIKVGDKITGGDFKFKDYYNSIGNYDNFCRFDFSNAPKMEEEDWKSVVDRSWQPKGINLDLFYNSFPFKAPASPKA